jgi:hypothetical protein
MTDQLDFGVNWVKGFSVKRASVSMDTFNILHYSTWIISSPTDVALLYHYKNSLKLTMSLVTKYYPKQPQKLVNAELCKLLLSILYNRMLIFSQVLPLICPFCSFLFGIYVLPRSNELRPVRPNNVSVP